MVLFVSLSSLFCSSSSASSSSTSSFYSSSSSLFLFFPICSSSFSYFSYSYFSASSWPLVDLHIFFFVYFFYTSLLMATKFPVGSLAVLSDFLLQISFNIPTKPFLVPSHHLTRKSCFTWFIYVYPCLALVQSIMGYGSLATNFGVDVKLKNYLPTHEQSEY